MLREAGAAEVHVRISSPPVTWPCFYGIDFATRAELVATGLAVDEVRASIGADSLGYISLEGMVEATRQPRERLCTACFTGEYPTPLPSVELLGKHALETPLPIDLPDAIRVAGTNVVGTNLVDIDGVSVGAPTGAADALSRP